MKTTKNVDILKYEKQKKIILLSTTTVTKSQEQNDEIILTDYKVLNLDGKQLKSFSDKAIKSNSSFSGTVSKVYCYEKFFVRTQCKLELAVDKKQELSHAYQVYTYKGNAICCGSLKWNKFDKKRIEYYNNISGEVDEEAYDRANQDY